MKTLVLIYDSLSYESAKHGWGLIDDVLERRFGAELCMIPCLAHAPYTPSSLTSIVTGLTPFTHGYNAFPPGKLDIPAKKYIFEEPDLNVKWTSTNMQSSYMLPSKHRLSLDDAVRFFKTHNDAILFVHVWETHIPYSNTDLSVGDAIEELKKLNSVQERMSYSHTGLKEALNQSLRFLDQMDMDEDYLILTADHGEAFGQQDYFNPDNSRYMHQHCTDEELIVPMITNFTPRTDACQLIDIKSTIERLYNVWNVAGQGTSILSTHYEYNEATGVSSCRWLYPGHNRYIENSTSTVVLSRTGNDIILEGVVKYDLDAAECEFYSYVDLASDPLYSEDYEKMVHSALIRAGCTDEDTFGAGVTDSDDFKSVINDKFKEKLKRLGYLN